VKRIIEFALFLILLLLIGGFVAENPARTTVAFLPEALAPGGIRLALPLGLIVLGSFALGLLLGALLTWLGLLRRLIVPWRNARRIAELERELAVLRAERERAQNAASPPAPAVPAR
jgi:uncharacterized integral membrane protein